MYGINADPDASYVMSNFCEASGSRLLHSFLACFRKNHLLLSLRYKYVQVYFPLMMQFIKYGKLGGGVMRVDWDRNQVMKHIENTNFNVHFVNGKRNVCSLTCGLRLLWHHVQI